MAHPREPTGEQCSANTPIEWNGRKAFACWYPQMGGYGGKAVVVPNNDAKGAEESTCFEVFVWHDGEFPYSAENGDDRSPAHLHHCSAQQFIRFGETVARLTAGGVS